MRHLWMISALALAPCTGEITNGGGDDGEDPPPETCDPARTYVGFGGAPLETDRPMIAAGSDRVRIKPFAALAGEYMRALALTAFDTRAYAATFGRPPARWYAEPAASANTIYAAFALAYDACGQHTATLGSYATAPNPTLADSLCRDLGRRAWQREPTDDEASACAAYAVDKTNPADDPRKRWAYACAAVLTASSFLAY